jgi:hypothetical protein
MTHHLWNHANNKTNDEHWKNATLDEVVDALFDRPDSVNECDIAAIKKYNPSATAKYIQMFNAVKIANNSTYGLPSD